MLDKYAPSGAEADERNGNWKRRRLTFKVKVVPYFSNELVSKGTTFTLKTNTSCTNT